MALLSSVFAMLGSFAGIAAEATEAATVGSADLWPVFIAILAALLAVTLLFTRHAIGSTPIPANVPVLPGGLPLIGAAIPALSNYARLHDWLYEVTQQMGEGRTFAFSLPLLPSSMMVTDPKCLEYVLKHRADNFIKGHRFYMNFGAILGHGIFTSDGAEWYWQRKLATHIFSVKSFKLYIDTVFGEKMALLTDVVGRAAASGSPLDLHDLMYRFTLDSFGQIGFGVDPGCLKTTDKVPFAAAFDSAQVVTNARFWQPAWSLIELLDGSGAALRRDVATIKAFALDIVQQRRKQLAAATAAAAAADGGSGRDQGDVDAANNNGANNNDVNNSSGSSSHAGSVVGEAQDLLSLFMAAPGPDGKPLSTQQLIDTVINFIIAGRDTTAQALSWTFYLLMQHPEVEEKLLQEIHSVLGPAAATATTAASQHNNKAVSNRDSCTDDTQPAAQQDTGAAAAGAGAGAGGVDGNSSSSGSVLRPSYDQLRSLRYARAVFLEALRLYPSVPENAKYAVQRDVLPDGTVVPAGTQVIYSPFVVNRLASVWGPDATTFRPERWLEMDKTPSPYNYLTFNAGPRLCLGQRLAELEGVFVLTGLLARFRFRRTNPDATVTYNLSPTLPMKGGLQVVAEARV